MKIIDILDGITAVVRGDRLIITVGPGALKRDVATDTVLGIYEKAASMGDVRTITVSGLQWRATTRDGNLATDYYTAVALNNSGFTLDGNDLVLRVTGPRLIKLLKGK